MTGARKRYWRLMVVAVVAFYFLSNGPLYWLYDRGVISNQIVDAVEQTVYQPGLWLESQIPAFGRLMNRYIELWR